MEAKKDNWVKKLERINTIVADSVSKFIRRFDAEIFVIVIAALALVLRIFLFKRDSGDINNFLRPWYSGILEDWHALGTQFGDYTPSYTYYFWFISLFKVNPHGEQFVYWIKSFSVFFDYALAVFAGLTIYHLSKSKLKSAITFGVVLMLPMCFLNSAWWGQCDSIFACFLMASIYFLTRNNQRTSLIFFGLAFSFKLQAIFILPIYIILMVKRQLKWRFILWIPIVYILMALPSCFISSNFFYRLYEILCVYVNQAGNSYQELTLNAGTFYSIIFDNFKQEAEISAFSVPFALGIVGTYTVIAIHSKEKMTNNMIVKALALFALLVPFFLPHMHDRYYYLADMLLIIYVMNNPKKFYVGLLGWLNSMIGYMTYLWGITFIEEARNNYSYSASFRAGALMAAAAIAFINIDIYKDFYPKNK